VTLQTLSKVFPPKESGKSSSFSVRSSLTREVCCEGMKNSKGCVGGRAYGHTITNICSSDLKSAAMEGQSTSRYYRCLSGPGMKVGDCTVRERFVEPGACQPQS